MVAPPATTVPLVTGVPIVVFPCRTVNVIVPSLTAPAGLVTVACRVIVWAPVPVAETLLTATVAAALATVRVAGERVLSLPARLPGLVSVYWATTEYVAAAVPAGRVKLALAAPPLTVPLETGEPIIAVPLNTANVTAPSPTGPAGLLTVALSVTV